MEGRPSRNAEDPNIGVELNSLANTRNTSRHGDASALERERADSLDHVGPTSVAPVKRRNLTWWSNNVCPAVSLIPGGEHSHSNDARDYLALERTFLAHVRTANTLVSFGVALVQLFRLKNVDGKAGIILGAITAGGGAVIVLAGGRRYFLQQKKLRAGRAVAGGATAWVDGLVVLTIVAAVLGVIVSGAAD
ncbi:MAG: hypothetical protein L6R39_001881 [Caloplaca ligustica]|nr:MAG: hypothetical protein L6R39_001881 [Caloplaca ligustica]